MKRLNKMNSSDNEQPLSIQNGRSNRSPATVSLTIVSILATSCFSFADPEKDSKGVREIDTASKAVVAKSDLPNGGKTGFYAILSPQVGGGKMVHYRMGEMKYLSVNPVLQVRDIKISTITGYSVVSVFMEPSSRKILLDQSKLPIPSMYAVAYMEDGQILWSRSLKDVLDENWNIVRIFDTKEKAEKLVKRLRLVK
ncbi:MAG: hypothetical protein AB8F34_06790 [Akkermansiaceae bacterium]